MLSPSLDSALVRILIDAASTRRSVGAGFLVTPQHLITCAHVVNDALGRPQNAAEQPDVSLLCDFPLLTGHPLARAKILRWFPVREEVGIGELEDIAVLELLPDSLLPAGAQPAPLVVLDSSEKALFAQKVRMFGFPAIAPDGTWANGVLQGLTAKGWVEIHHADSGRVEPGFSGTAVWSVQENAVCGMTVSKLSSAASYMIPAAALIQAFPEIDKSSRPANPYRGMEAFREKDARFYFGRETDAATLREKIEKQPFTAVIGASGSGKSSLVFAGLLPMLRQSGGWLICSCRPKQQPFHELAACLIPLLYEDELERVKKSRICADDLRSGELLLYDLLRRILDKNDNQRLLLFVDQFEELFTLHKEQAGWIRHYFKMLFESAYQEGIAVIVALRADFLETALGYSVLAEALSKYPPSIISPINEKGLRTAIEQPAVMSGVTFEPGLTDLLIRDLNREPGSLPLLEFCLMQIWEQQLFRRISHEAYKSIGGVQQALTNYAEQVYVEFAGDNWEHIRRIFLKLVRPGQGTEDTRQVANFAQFSSVQRNVIKILADRRLVVTGLDAKNQESTVEVVHEALIRRWYTLRQWVDEERDFLVWREKLKVLLRQWEDINYDNSALLRGRPLHEALKWQTTHLDHLEDKEINFIKNSKKTEEMEVDIEVRREQKIKELEMITEEMEKNKDLLVEAERYAAVGQVAAQLAHNIRNPITAIGGTARLLARKSSDPQQLNFLSMMVSGVEKIEQTLEDLLNFVDKSPPVKEIMPLYPMIIKSLMLFYRIMQKHGVEYEVIMPDRKFTCCVDPRQMKRVLIHLIRNAVEAMKEGGQLTVEVVSDVEQMHIYVRDSGTGIAEADLQRAAEPFYSNKPGGTGVGLSLVTRVVRDHGGTMSIRRRETGGTEVKITLPL